MPHVLIVDNYDSFTFNLVQLLRAEGASVEVFLNDAIDVGGLASRHADGLVISPGPCAPQQAGVSVDSIQKLSGRLPILGVCLGHQAIAHAFGGRVMRAAQPVHGKTSAIHHDGEGLFEGLPSPFSATRYHSLVVERASLPQCLHVTATTDAGEIMALRHTAFDVVGVQFHPESFLTTSGPRLVANWLRGLGSASAAAASIVK